MQGIKDSFGRVLHLGDKLIVTTGEPSMYTMVDLTPAVDPRLPKGAVLLTLQATLRMVVADGKPIPGFVRVLSVAEQGLTAGEGSDARKDGGDGPPEKQTTLRLTDD